MKRNTNIELLRFILMIAIFSWHILIYGYDFIKVEEIPVGGNDFLFYLAGSLLAPATYYFMFISGYYGITFTPRKPSP